MGLEKLEELLGHRFGDPELLERALTHRSWAFENLEGRSPAELRRSENETLEFLGDSLLGLAVAEHLFRKHPDLGEGDLTLMKHRLVSTATLAEIAVEYGLGEHIRIGKGEERTGGREKPAILANTLEAVLAAVFLDSDYQTASALVDRMFTGHFRRATPQGSLDHKSVLQERLQGARSKAPVYTLIETVGPPHDRTFRVRAEFEGGESEGLGRSIKSAEMDAARKALESLGSASSGPPKN